MKAPKGELRTFLRDAEQLGFTFVGYDGRNHPRLYNRGTGDHFSVPLTPSDWRSQRNALACLERLAGAKLPRQRSGKYKHCKQTQLDVTLSSAEKQASARVTALLEEADALRRRVEQLAADPSRNAVAEARRALTEYEHIRAQLERLHRIIPPIAE